MADFGLITIPLAIAAVGAYTANEQSRKNNNAVTDSIESTRAAGNVNRNQAADATAIEKMKRLNQSEAIRARLAVAAVERGVGTGGSAAALEKSVIYDTELDNAIADKNLANTNAAIESSVQANTKQLAARQVNPLMAAFSGGLGGLSAGLNIAGLFGGSSGTPTQPSKTGTEEDFFR